MIVALSGLCVLVYGLQTVLSLAQSATPPPPPHKTHKILTAGIRRLIRSLFINNRSDVCFITNALPGVLKSWGERPFIFRAGPHNPHGPYFIVQKNLDLTM